MTEIIFRQIPHFTISQEKVCILSLSPPKQGEDQAYENLKRSSYSQEE